MWYFQPYWTIEPLMTSLCDVIMTSQNKIAQNKLTKAKRKEAVHGWIIATRENSVALVPHTTSWDGSEVGDEIFDRARSDFKQNKIVNPNNISCKCLMMKLENLTCSTGKSTAVFSSSSISIESVFLSIGGKGRLTGQHVNFFAELCNWPLVGLLLILLSSFFFGLRSFDTTRTGCVKVVYKFGSHLGSLVWINVHHFAFNRGGTWRARAWRSTDGGAVLKVRFSVTY